nr:MAG TPA: hypothetical protein [Bacteriophage sp.]
MPSASLILIHTHDKIEKNIVVSRSTLSCCSCYS